MIPTVPDTPPDSPNFPPTVQLAAMSVSGNNENDKPAGAPSIEVSGDSAGTPRKHRPSPLHVQSEAEKFPCFLPAPKPVPKSKSLTEAEIKSEVLNDTQVAAIATQLQYDAPPLSLEEARQRRESIKDERKKSIDFIRRRTMSRASTLGRPNLEALNEPKFDQVAEGEKKE
ncbi:hypothetical protein ONS95_007315 [Cadophora gregata]|uniref:uncharacterized protein n=1 Tax=Cadophora gregata TaxID=51156 RepID=UPI0026DBE7E5|nr:uncharacterized protein ONS95_007315 [Cadophora gregata]KAK0100868.1 hypothetical protein ONS95_007315 [Cadophora gregata]KAK0117139.1 hypothetical protein ONS96_012973 [Cadophora gregata f. sp. sojae]